MRGLISRHANPATIIAIVALTFAMTGGAYAITGGSNGGGARANAHIAKKGKSKGSRGPRGPAGPRGPEGKQGPAGSPGAEGKQGPQGAEGKAGAAGNAGAAGGAGANGKSATVSETAPGCTEGGITIEVEGSKTPHEICNGEKGDKGEAGEPGVIHPGETLAERASETGSWSVGPVNDESVPILVEGHTLLVTVASFPIPLKTPLGATAVHYIKANGNEVKVNAGKIEEVPSATCKGTAEEPTAPAGNLCVYVSTESEIAPEHLLVESYESTMFQPGGPNIAEGGTPTAGAGATGAWMPMAAEGERAYAIGTWAVTAP